MRLVSPVSFVLLVGSLSACADKGDEGMFILNNSAAVGGCSFTGDPTQLSTAAGEISYLAGNAGPGYILAPLIESRITADMGNEAQRTIHLEGANVTVAVANGGTSQSFTTLFSGSVAPNGGTTNVVFEVLPPSSILALGSASQSIVLIASITPYGTLGGGRIDGEPFQYPITILAPGKGGVSGVGTANSIASGGISCGSMALPMASTMSNPCNLYQDGVVDCCISNVGGTVHDVCPAAADASVFP
jgi:hypothetical protein